MEFSALDPARRFFGDNRDRDNGDRRFFENDHDDDDTRRDGARGAFDNGEGDNGDNGM